MDYFLPAFFLPATCMRLGALARPRVCLGVLAAHGQTTPVAQAAIAADLLQALDGRGAHSRRRSPSTTTELSIPSRA